MIVDVSNVISEVEQKARNILAASDKIAEIAGDTKTTMGQVTEDANTISADGLQSVRDYAGK